MFPRLNDVKVSCVENLFVHVYKAICTIDGIQIKLCYQNIPCGMYKKYQIYFYIFYYYEIKV